MPAYELREHLQTHGYAVLGRYAAADAARAQLDALVAEDRYRMGRYTIDYVQQGEPDEMGLRRTKTDKVEAPTLEAVADARREAAAPADANARPKDSAAQAVPTPETVRVVEAQAPKTVAKR